MNNNIMKRNCPVCGLEEFNILAEINYSENEKLTGLPSKYYLVECKKCGMVFFNFNAVEEDFDNYYKYNANCNNKFCKKGIHGEAIINSHQQIINTITPYIEKNAKIIDIGTANGLFLNLLKKNGFTNLYGVEPDIKCIQNFSSQDIKILEGNICKTLNFNEKFDFVNLQQVLEHIYNVKDALKNIRELLCDGGYLMINVPDAEKYIEHYRCPFGLFYYEHINHFNEISLSNLLFKNGFKVIKKIQYNRFHTEIGILAQKVNNFPIIKAAKNTKLKEYIKKSKIEMDSLINRCIKNKNPLIIWGGGGYSSILFGNGLNASKVAQIIDSSPLKIGKKIHNLTIQTPEEIINGDNTILVTAHYLHNEDIKKQIKNLGLKNPVEFIYENKKKGI